jgi:general secretion pathway protein H
LSTSAPARTIASRRTDVAGFTLVELMVVVVIIGVLVAGAMLSLGATGRDSQLEQERDRLVGMIQYVRERAELQTREYGLRCTPDGYQFVVYDSRGNVWQADDLDTSLRERHLPVGLEFALVLEGRKVVLEAPKPQTGLKSSVEDLTPQIMLLSSGDTSDFALTLQRGAPHRSLTLKSNVDGELVIGDIVDERS